VEPGHAVRGGEQAGFGAAGPVHPPQGRHQRVRDAFLSAAGAESGNDVTDTVGKSLTMVEALIFRALSLV
jgi:hypothetical protein